MHIFRCQRFWNITFLENGKISLGLNLFLDIILSNSILLQEANPMGAYTYFICIFKQENSLCFSFVHWLRAEGTSGSHGHWRHWQMCCPYQGSNVQNAFWGGTQCTCSPNSAGLGGHLHKLWGLLMQFFSNHYWTCLAKRILFLTKRWQPLPWFFQESSCLV